MISLLRKGDNYLAHLSPGECNPVYGTKTDWTQISELLKGNGGGRFVFKQIAVARLLYDFGDEVGYAIWNPERPEFRRLIDSATAKELYSNIESKLNSENLPNEYELNSAQHESVQKILDDHSLWINTGGLHGKRANVFGRDLSYISFKNANLYKARFRFCKFNSNDMKGVDFRCADLTGSEFAIAMLEYADLREAVLHKCKVRQSFIDGALFNKADVSEADFSGTSVKKANFDNAIFGVGWLVNRRSEN